MFSKLKNTLENFARKSEGKEPLDKEITDFLHAKHSDNFDLDELNSAYEEIRKYHDNLELRKDLLENKTVLDVGSSKHFFDEYCKAKYNSTVVALDYDEDSLGTEHPMGVAADAKTLPFKNESFDLVISHASMPHLFVLGEDEEGNEVPLEGDIAEKSRQDVFSLFQEVYRVLKVGGQARMSTFSEGEIKSMFQKGEFEGIEVLKNGEWVPQNEEGSVKYELSRVRIIKEVLSRFEKESGAQCIFKDDKRGGLIIIRKIK